MLNLSSYSLDPAEKQILTDLLSCEQCELSLESLWRLMDQVWVETGCSNYKYNPKYLQLFYSHPIWILNGIFIENDDVSLAHRQFFADVILRFNPKTILEFGGGFGTLSRLLAARAPSVQIDIFEPYPSNCALKLVDNFQNVRFIDQLYPSRYSFLACTDVLEHVQDPLLLLSELVLSVELSGHLLIANCFEPVILCHLPETFHLRYSFDFFCFCLGLKKIHGVNLPYGSIYCRYKTFKFPFYVIRILEYISKIMYFPNKLLFTYCKPKLRNLLRKCC